MGFTNPRMPWGELEARLSNGTVSSRPPTESDSRSGPEASTNQRARRSTNGGRSRVPYAELHCHSHFSFLDGASSPDELVAEADRLGLEALALCDHDGLYGVVRFAEAAREVGLPTVFGTEVTLDAPTRFDPGAPDPAGAHLVLLATGPDGYRSLSRRASLAQLAGEKGAPRQSLRDLGDLGDGVIALTGCRKGAVPAALETHGPAVAARELARLVELFGRDRVFVELWDHGQPLDGPRNDALAELAVRARVGVVATNNVHYATPAAQPLATALAAVRARRSLDDLDGWLPASASAHLRSGAEQRRRFARYPGAVETTVELARTCAFDLALVAPALPPFPCPDGLDEMGYLRHLVTEGATRRYGPRPGSPHPPPMPKFAQPGRSARHARKYFINPGNAAQPPGEAAPPGDTRMPKARRAGPPGPPEPQSNTAQPPGEAAPPGDTRMPKARRAGPPGPPEPQSNAAWHQIDHELAVIDSLGFAGYFLVVWDIVRFCAEADIYCQGRGSAANSAVCFSLGITRADAVRLGLLFERFLSPARDGPPDIDLDIESGRREEVIQYVYERYGRHHAAQVANVITYRGRSAVRDMARALGFSPGQQDAWAKQVDRWEPLAAQPPGGAAPTSSTRMPKARRAGPTGPPEPQSNTAQPPGPPEPQSNTAHSIPPAVLDMARQLQGAPRHLGIHSGGMVICDRPVIEVCPVERARMPGRTVLQWDKDDCAVAGLVKFDLLGLGMLTALHHAVDLIAAHRGYELDLAALDQDEAVYDMLCRADSIGVFQVESRAQMATLPRLKPRTFYDLVVEVALIRPGPIQGGSVHPYIRRRNGTEPVTYPHPLLEPALAKTLGVPLFQEQFMQIAIDAAGFSATEADALRQAMSAKRSHARMDRLRSRLFSGMAERGITGAVAEDIWHKLVAFADYGFPESHSVSFAYLVYASAWIKHYEPAAFCAALLNAQPMGFYSPHTLCQDARRHGVEVHGPDLAQSMAGAVLEPCTDSHNGVAVRLGLSSVQGLGTELAEAIVAERDAHGPFADLADLAHRGGLNRAQLEALALAGAATTLRSRQAEQRSTHDPDGEARASRTEGPPELESRHRRQALWAAGAAAQSRPGRLPGIVTGTVAPPLPGMSPAEEAVADLAATGISAQGHPTRFIRDELDRRGVIPAARLATVGRSGEPDEPRGTAAPSSTPKYFRSGRPAQHPGANFGGGGVPGAPPEPQSNAAQPPGEAAPPDETRMPKARRAGPTGPPERPSNKVTVAGVVTHRQRPATAGGTMFINLEDETGLINVICSKGCWTRYRAVAARAPRSWCGDGWNGQTGW